MVTAFLAGCIADEVQSWVTGPNAATYCVATEDRSVPAGTPTAPDTGCRPEDWEVCGYYRDEEEIVTPDDLDASKFEAEPCS